MKVSDEDSPCHVFDDQTEAYKLAKIIEPEYVAGFKMKGIDYWVVVP